MVQFGPKNQPFQSSPALRGRTILHYSVESKRACHTISALVSHGVDIWATDSHKRSVLHHAARVGNLPAVKALLALGMGDDLRAADCFGMTPLKLAAHHKAQEALTFLTEIESNLECSRKLAEPGLVEDTVEPDYSGGGKSVISFRYKQRSVITKRR